ncbi:carboxypeptidase-like regulatory domain-containing protein [Hymenobacter sp. BT188]|uniref:carboxypeptidase-like regulatory domain-containing protein n=1 Tax=Hymenobacter sp. BT188 TaxID=2763504 RepID=UPI001650FE5A|nr:carboxypeptidase-like regulatory domain-containing protein [Hymenobacter sp. BT188]MBC6605668.1 carboxypeptidase-like regulatory domain-containing protein [Hymenobacter sp. BT188]
MLRCPRFALVLLYLLSWQSAAAQQRLAQGRQRSYYTKVFRLTDAQTLLLYQKGLAAARASFFTQPVDSFLTDSLRQWRRPLPVGYYLVAHTEGPRLVYWLRSVTDREVLVLDNQVDLALVVRDTTGHLLDGKARVSISGHDVPFDAATQSFRKARGGRGGNVAVTQGGRTTYHLLNRTFPAKNQPTVRSVANRVVFGFPLGYLTGPVRNFVRSLQHFSYTTTGLVGLVRSVFSEDVRYERQDQHERRREQAWTHYMVFSKPRYRAQGDTLRLKARVLRRDGGWPSTAPLTLWLTNASKAKKIAVLRPERPGSYVFELPLTDTLGLQSSRPVYVRLADSHDVTLASSEFQLEDYELKNTRYTLRVAETEQRRGTPQALFLRGTDANELNLLDARVRVAVVPTEVTRLAAPVVFVPDTLWTHAQALDPMGETRLNLPPSQLPAADLRYRVEATFLNSDNERHAELADVTYHLDSDQLTVQLHNDSVQLRFQQAGKNAPQQATLEIWPPDSALKKPLFRGPVQLPLELPVLPQAARYVLRDATGRTAELNLTPANAALALRSDRIHDSIFVEMENPHRLAFWYFLYRGNELVRRGYGRELKLAEQASSPEPWFASVQYEWGGQMRTEEYSMPLIQSQLQVRAEQPVVAYPGQRIRLTYHVTDAGGAPVPHADLTSYAYTSKFRQPEAPELPSFEPPTVGRRAGRRFRMAEQFDNKPEQTSQQPLDWEQWRRQLGLDSLVFYQFLYPEFGVFGEYRSAPGGLTQVAPFVVDSGRVQPAAAVYLDGVPIYIRVINHTEPYALVADSGYHTLAVRTATRLITLRGVYLQPLYKLTISLDLNHSRPDMTVEERPITFTNLEQVELNRRLLPVSVTNLPPGELPTLRQGTRLQVLTYQYRSQQDYRNPVWMGGPFRADSVLYREGSGLRQKFLFEPTYRYAFAPGLLKQTSMEPYRFERLARYSDADSIPLRGFAYTEAAVRKLQEPFNLQSTSNTWTSVRLDDTVRTRVGQGRLVLWAPPTEVDAQPQTSALPAVLYTAITQQGQPKFGCLLRGLAPVQGLKPGKYRVAVLLADSTCLVPADVEVRAGGTTYVQLQHTHRQPKGAVSQRMRRFIESRTIRSTAASEHPAVRTYKFREVLAAERRGWPLVRGRVLDKLSDEGLPGVTVLVKGTSVGVSSNADGSFELNIPYGGTLVFSFIGYITVERVVIGRELEISLSADTKQLSEVVVTGYAEMKRSNLTYAVSSVIAGASPGVNIVRVRGNASLSMTNQPLYIVDGLPFNGRVENIDPASILSTTVLKGAQAEAIYGSKAAGGVVIIKTKAAKTPRSLTDPMAPADADNGQPDGRDPRLALRRRFSDVGWWRPNLLTDARGQATTEVTLLDDVTGWDTFVLGSDNHGRTGSATTTLRSFKGLMSELAVPRFLVAGDRAQVLGKTLNYLPDTAQVTITFRLGNTIACTTHHQVVTSALDTLTVTAPAADSLQVTFSLQKPDGYADGEVRTVPVLPAGTRERVGTFAVLTAADTTLQLTFDPKLGETTVRLESDPLPLLLDEIRHVQQYDYLCNEQAASKLKALLLEQRIREFLHQPFTHAKDVNQLIRRLRQGQQKPGLWGTWPTAPISAWTTLHVLEALLEAEKQGYKVQFDRDEVQVYLLKQLDLSFAEKRDAAFVGGFFTTPDDRLRLLQLLHRLGIQTDYATYITRLERGRQQLDTYLALTNLRQELKLPYQLDSLRRHCFTTQLGGVFYEDTLRTSSYYRYLLNRRVGTTLLAYRVLRAAGGGGAELMRIRTFLLNQRRVGHWASTYEAAQILETIGPDLFEAGRATVARVQLSGGLQQEVTQFPFEAKMPPSAGLLTLRKEGLLPVYAIAYQTFWNPQPPTVSAPFRVATTLAGQTGTQVKLRAGQPAELLVTVDVAAEARYVLLEVPIPAGCSYGDNKPGNSFEVHREYLRHQTGIFIDVLSVGRHTFRIALQPRFRGRYTLNPARAELMYFPTRFGRAASKQAIVE